MSHIGAMSGIDEAQSASGGRRPTVRSRYDDDQELELSKKVPELYESGQNVYIKVGRRVNPAVHQIHRALGDGQYQLSRHGTVVQNKAGTAPEIYLEENLQTKSPARFTSDQTVYVKGERGVDPAPYKIHQVLDDGKYQLSKGGKLELKEDGMTPKEYSEDSLQTHQ